MDKTSVCSEQNNQDNEETKVHYEQVNGVKKILRGTFVLKNWYKKWGLGFIVPGSINIKLQGDKFRLAKR